MDTQLQDRSTLCKAAHGRFPFRNHRTMQQVLYDQYLRRVDADKHVTFKEWLDRG